MSKIRLDIGGEKGNALYIMATVRRLCVGDQDPSEICTRMRGEIFNKLGGHESSHNYEDLLRVYLREFPFVELYATHDIGIDQELYTLDANPEIHEL